MNHPTSAEISEAAAGGEYLRERTGFSSWAVVLLGENAFRCNRCGDRFEPSEEAVAFHYSRECTHRLGVPAYVPGDPDPARLPSTAV